MNDHIGSTEIHGLGDLTSSAAHIGKRGWSRVSNRYPSSLDFFLLFELSLEKGACISQRSHVTSFSVSRCFCCTAGIPDHSEPQRWFNCCLFAL